MIIEANMLEKLSADLARAHHAGEDTVEVNIYDLALLILVFERSQVTIDELKAAVQQFKDDAMNRIKEQTS